MFRYGWKLTLVCLLAGCGSSAPLGMKVSCTNGTSVEPVPRFEVRQVPAVGSNAPTAMISYPDPLHPDQTGTLTLAPGERCTATLSTKS
jgi:hypothetical protein